MLLIVFHLLIFFFALLLLYSIYFILLYFGIFLLIFFYFKMVLLRKLPIRKCGRGLWGLFSFTSKLAVVGGVAGVAHYAYMYHTIDNTPQAMEDAVLHAGVLDSNVYDVAIVGGGIIGIATAREVRKRWPGKSVVVLEKEGNVAQHQSGHPSGCIHAGMYYTPGSVMARLCPRGAQMLIDYCKANRLPYQMCGKLIVGTEENDVEVIEKLYENGVANGVKGLQILRSPSAIKSKEPLVEGQVALYSKNTGMVDFGAVTKHMRDELVKNGKDKFFIRYNFQVLDFVGVQMPSKTITGNGEAVVPREAVVIRGREEGQLGPEKRIIAKNVITCCGLGADSIASTTSLRGWWGPKVKQMYSFRGKYYQLKPEKKNVVSMHVYPCPDLSKGIGVGVHISPTINLDRGGNTILGPGSAFAFHPYGYSPYDVDLKYLFKSIFSLGGWISLLSNWQTLLETYRVDLSKAAFVGEVQKLIPSITEDDVNESFSGVMSMGVGSNGILCSDLSLDYTRPQITLPVTVEDKWNNGLSFRPREAVIHDSSYPLIIHVRNAPSPAATASLAIAEEIVAASSLAFMWHLKR